MLALRAWFPIAVVVLAGACRDTSAPSRPSAVVKLSADGMSAMVGTSTDASLRVTNAAGRGVGGVTVSWSAGATASTVSPASSVTNELGEARTTWSFGTMPGAKTLVASVAGLNPVTFSASAVAGAAASVSASGLLPANVAAGSLVPPIPAVIVRDEFGNPVSGVPVMFAIASGGGALTDSVQTTNTQGMARPGSWRLGPAAGANALSAAVGALAPVSIAVTGVPGPPATVQLLAGRDQQGAPGSTLPVSPSVRVTDLYENPVPGVSVAFTLMPGGGNVTSPQQVTDSNGSASAGTWTLGTLVGHHTLYVTAATLPSIEVVAGVTPPADFNISVEAVHLNQGTQSPGAGIGGVSMRPGILRIMARATTENNYAPPVRVRLFQDGTLLRDTLLPAPAQGVPTEPTLDLLSHTWNLRLSAEEVVSGLAVDVVIDPDATIPVMSRDDNSYPQSGEPASLDVRPLSPLRVIFIPIHSSATGTVGRITQGNVETYLAGTRQWTPAGSIISTVREPVTTDLDLRTGSGWSTLLGQIQALRTLEGARDEYYHGIIGDFSGIPLGGLAFRPLSPSSHSRSALSYDRLPPAAATIAHELGHNLGRPHAPCGNAAGIDANYPHANATLGAPGYDVLTGDLRMPNAYRDYMSYCSPQWTSDYTYASILQWRRSDPLAQPGLAAASASPAGADGLLLWGRISAGQVVLEPALSFTSSASLPETGGPNALRGVAADGREMFRLSFAAVAVEDGEPGEQHFSFFLPMGAGDMAALDRIELSTPHGSAVRRPAVPPAAGRGGGIGAPGVARPEPRVERLDAERIRVSWDADRYPLAVVRDRATGRVLSFGRGGDIGIVSGGTAAGDIELILSDGVRSRVVR